MRKKNEPKFVISQRGIGEPKTCLPANLQADDLIEVACIGDEWTKFIDTKTGKVHDCADYYRMAMQEAEL